MLARFDENPAMTLQVIKKTKRYGRTDGCTNARTHGQRENSMPHHKQSLRGGIIMRNNPNLDLININAYLKLSDILYICSHDIERKPKF